MRYKETDNFANLKVGDTLVMDDGKKFDVVKDYVGSINCDYCDIGRSICHKVSDFCFDNEYHFEQLTP